jgi:hypothetical protein
VLVEKILRVQPDVKKLFLLIRAADVESAKQRVETEVKTKYFSLFTYKDSGIIYFKRSARALPKYISRRKKSYIGKLHTGSKKKKATNNKPLLPWKKKLAPTIEENRV